MTRKFNKPKWMKLSKEDRNHRVMLKELRRKARCFPKGKVGSQFGANGRKLRNIGMCVCSLKGWAETQKSAIEAMEKFKQSMNKFGQTLNPKKEGV